MHIQNTFVKFVLVGIVNTFTGIAVMFFCYNVFLLGYWGSSAVAYIVGGIVSYFLNKFYTFSCHGYTWQEMGRFILLLLICYFIAYGCAKPFTMYLLKDISLSLLDVNQVAMLVGMVFYTVLNYLGQKILVFRYKV